MLKAERAGAALRHQATIPFHRGIIACEERVEEAVLFLVKVLAPRSRRGKKAVVLHSLRVGFYLMSLGFGEDVVIAGILHDVAEKTDHSPGALGRRFGGRIGRIVAAVTNNQRIHDALGRYEDSIRRCRECGEEALIVRAADLMDNSDRLLARGSDERLIKMADKIRLLLKTCRDAGVDARVVEDLSRRLRRIGRRAGGATLTRIRAG